MVQLGIDRLYEYKHLFEGKRIGLITNFSGVSSNLIEDLDVFDQCGLSVCKLFTPEHGLYGAMDGEKLEDMRHPKYHIPMISLYGDKKEPSKDDLEGVELLVYDIQDVGLRYYTYIYTLAYCMQAAAKQQLAFIVLDRPNPLGSQVDGNQMSPEFDGFVGAHRLALRYGLTVGELGFYYKDFFSLDLNYTVIPMKGYTKDMLWPMTGQLWNLPSPSIHTFQSCQCYLGGCFFEATNISEGRGTAEPFQIYGAPFVQLDSFITELRHRIQDDALAIRPRAFTPFWSKHAGKVCYGVEFIPRDNTLNFLPHALVTMKTFLDLYPDKVQFVSYADVARLSSLSGDQSANDYLEGRLTLSDLLTSWHEQALAFDSLTKDFRIYH